MFSPKLFLLVLAILGGALKIFAQSGPGEQYRFSLLDINHGLSHNQVKCFIKDSKGYLWVGTTSGLNRYDGHSFKVFTYNSKDSSSIAGNTILRLAEAPEGKIWVHSIAGFSIYDPETEKFSRNRSSYTQQYNLPDAKIDDIYKDMEGNYWFLSNGQGITRFDPKSRQSINLKHLPSSSYAISTDYVSAIKQNSKGELWIIHQNGILEKLNAQTLKVEERYEEIYHQLQHLPISHTFLNYEITVDSDDDLWIYMPSHAVGVFFFDRQQKAITRINKKSAPLALNNDLVRGVVESEKGLIWLGTDHGGINVLDKKHKRVQHILHSNELEKSLAHNSIQSLYKDKEGIIWVGTFKNGINFYHKNIIRFPHIKHQRAIKESLPFDDVNAFAEDHKGNLWIGTNGGGLLYLDRSSNTFREYRHNPKDPQSITSDIIVSLMVDKNNELWIGTYLGGLDRFDGKVFKHYRHNINDPQSLSDNNVWELLQDSRGNIWIGTLRGGLELYDPAIDGFHHSNVHSGMYPLHCDYINNLTEDKHGNIWVGGGFGVDVIHPVTGKSTYFAHNPDQPGSLTSNNLMSIYRDSKDNIWIGTNEGLNLYNEKENIFYHFTTEDGLPSNVIVAILEDENNNLWLSTHNGLANLVLEKGWKSGKPRMTCRSYDELDGLQGKFFNENAALKSSRGEMIFGGPKGMHIFNAGDIGKNTIAPHLVFTDFQLFNKSLEAGKSINGRVILSKAIAETKQVALEHDQNVFSIEFATLSVFHPEKNKYKYKLEGFDKGWHTVDDTKRRVTYTNLDPGEYEFKVLASNNDGVWNEEGISLTVKVLAPFWMTHEAFLLYFIMGILTLFFARKIELKRAKTKFELEQERREARQLRELDLMKIRFFTNLSHEFRTPLALILTPLEKLIDTANDPNQKKQFLLINRNAKRLLNLVNQLLDFRKLEVEEVNLYPSEGNIIRFIQTTVSSFSDISEKKNISLSFETSVQDLQASFDMDKLEKVLFNLLSNAFKFTPEEGKIQVEVNCYDNDSSSEGLKIVEIKVKDTGIGIPKEKQERIFERFFQHEVPDQLINQGSGIGLSITKEFVKIHGGMITVESEPGLGSCFTVKLPVKEITAKKEDKKPVAEVPEPFEEEATAYTDELQEEKLEKVLVAQDASRPVVLLVEDNEDFRSYLKENLEYHFTILEAKNGKEGWQKALSCLPDLVVSDLMMPELNGIELCKKIKGDARTSHTPFVMLTAHSSEEHKLKGLDLGANDYITKPFNFEILLSRLRNLITQREQLQKAYNKKISVQTSEVNIVSLDDKLIQNAIKVVEENIADPDFSVEALSKELGMSRVHLYKKMVSLTGLSPVEFIRKIRLQRAAQFLEKSQLTVAEVAYKVGFNNRKYFTKYFKEEYNVLPSVYASSKHSKED